MHCGASRVERRPARQRTYALSLFRDYLTHYEAKARVGERHQLRSRSTTYRRVQPFLDVIMSPLPRAPGHAASYAALMLDGFYIAYPSVKEHRHLPGAKTDESILLLAIDAITHEPLHWHIYHRLEDTTAWQLFFAEIVALGFSPLYLVHDGHQGIRRAANRFMPHALHQRCLVHMVRNVHKDIGITPKAPLARQLQTLIYQLVDVRTYDDKKRWLHAWSEYLAAYVADELAHAPRTKAFGSLHAVVLHAYERHELFTFLDYPHLPHSTNAIESRNRVLREALRRHRGLPLVKQEALVSWLLLFKCTDDLTVIRAWYERQRE